MSQMKGLVIFLITLCAEGETRSKVKSKLYSTPETGLFQQISWALKMHQRAQGSHCTSTATFQTDPRVPSISKPVVQKTGEIHPASKPSLLLDFCCSLKRQKIFFQTLAAKRIFLLCWNYGTIYEATTDDASIIFWSSSSSAAGSPRFQPSSLLLWLGIQ